MRRAWLVVVSGPPLSGKSRLAKRLAADLGLPLLAKDAFKEALFEVLGTGDPQWSRTLSRAAFEAQFTAADAALRVGRDILLEGNFREEDHGGRLRRLARRRARLLQVACRADARVLQARHAARARDDRRHAGHLDAVTVWRVGDLARYGPLSIRPTFRYDTGPGAARDYASLMDRLAAAGLRRSGAAAGAERVGAG